MPVVSPGLKVGDAGPDPLDPPGPGAFGGARENEWWVRRDDLSSGRFGEWLKNEILCLSQFQKAVAPARFLHRGDPLYRSGREKLAGRQFGRTALSQLTGNWMLKRLTKVPCVKYVKAQISPQRSPCRFASNTSLGVFVKIGSGAAKGSAEGSPPNPSREERWPSSRDTLAAQTCRLISRGRANDVATGKPANAAISRCQRSMTRYRFHSPRDGGRSSRQGEVPFSCYGRSCGDMALGPSRIPDRKRLHHPQPCLTERWFLPLVPTRA